MPPEMTPEVLAEKLVGKTSVQIDAITRTYTGKWIRAEGTVNDVATAGGDRWMLFVDMPNSRVMISGVFQKEDHDRLMALTIGEWVTIEGQITRLKNGASLEPCHILHVGPSPNADGAQKEKSRGP
ncbi:MAG: hypothetical protein JSR98_07285 [Proteobacteria bacterium]|nr:hypothetical protein [Pseudomonadota bacterium]